MADVPIYPLTRHLFRPYGDVIEIQDAFDAAVQAQPVPAETAIAVPAPPPAPTD